MPWRHILPSSSIKVVLVSCLSLFLILQQTAARFSRSLLRIKNLHYVLSLGFDILVLKTVLLWSSGQHCPCVLHRNGWYWYLVCQMQGIFTGISWGLELSLEAKNDRGGYKTMHLKWNLPSDTSLHSDSSVSLSWYPYIQGTAVQHRWLLQGIVRRRQSVISTASWDWRFIAKEKGEKISIVSEGSN